MRYKEPYSHYKRKTKSGKTVYYYRTYDEEGRRTNGISTGCTTLSSFRTYMANLIRKGELLPKKDLKFSDFTEDFWAYDKCKYVQMKNSRKENSISKEHCKTEQGYLKNHILPYFEIMNLSSIKSHHIENWILTLKGKVSDSTINHLLRNFKVIMRFAYDQGHIHNNPASGIQQLQTKSKERGILTLEEVKLLFEPSTIDTVWKDDLISYTLNLFSAATGIRKGESLGLLNKYVYEDHVEIVQAYGQITKDLKDTKTKRSRYIPIPSTVSKYLKMIKGDDPDGFFFSLHNGLVPYTSRDVTENLYSALQKIRITEENRKKRNITFHSWRHFFNTYMRGMNVADSKVQAVTGHQTQRMTDHYTHFELSHYQEVVEAQEKMF